MSFSSNGKELVSYAHDLGTFRIVRAPLIIARGLSAQGYGTKIQTDCCLYFDHDKKRRRIYAHCVSNVASHYILIHGERFHLRDSAFDNVEE